MVSYSHHHTFLFYCVMSVNTQHALVWDAVFHNSLFACKTQGSMQSVPSSYFYVEMKSFHFIQNNLFLMKLLPTKNLISDICLQVQVYVCSHGNSSFLSSPGMSVYQEMAVHVGLCLASGHSLPPITECEVHSSA